MSAELTDRFRPEADVQYGKCKTCSIDLTTRQEVDIHMNATLAEATAKGERSGHTVRILNPSRESRIRSEVADLVEEAISEVMSKLEDLVYRNHITEAEAKEAISHEPDFAEAWEDYCDE